MIELISPAMVKLNTNSHLFFFFFFRECHGSSGAQTHIDGNKPGEGDTDFYGVAQMSSSSCMVEFDC